MIYYIKFYLKIDSTARAVTLLRDNISQWKRKDNSSLGYDYLAKKFVSQDPIARLGHDIMYKISPNHFYFYLTNSLAARTLFFDEFINRNIKNYHQFVILGSGYDTRAKRFEKELQNFTIFEVDKKQIQKEKRKICKGLNWPKNVHFVETNFLKDSLKDSLFKAGYNSKLNTLFLMEGVTMYLDEQSIRGTLSFIRNYSNNSLIGFDYFQNSFSFIKKIGVRFFGEKFTFNFNNTDEFLRSEGFHIERKLAHHDMENYLSQIYSQNLTTTPDYHFLVAEKQGK